MARSLVVSLAAGLVLCAGAAAHGPEPGQVYWANSGGTTIGRANADGTAITPNFITGATAPRGVAIDASHVYWTNDGAPGAIGRADLDGTDANQAFVAVGASPHGITLDATRIYWTNTVFNSTTMTNEGKVGRANLDGTGATSSLASTATASTCGLSTDGHQLYFANPGMSSSLASFHPPFGLNQSFITGTADPCGVAVAGRRIYWANRGPGTVGIGRADIDGSNVDQSFIPTTSAPCGVAVDAAHVWWTNAAGAVGRAELDGSNPNESYIAGMGISGPCGIAVTPTVTADPLSHLFGETAVGGRSAIQSVLVSNTSSSVLDVADVSLVGADPGDFEITGDGCTVAVTPASAGCIVNVRFAPAAAGTRSAALRVNSNAAGSSLDIVLAGVGAMPEAARSLGLSHSQRRDTFHGRLSSDEPACVEQQKVKVFRRRPQDDRKVGTDTSGSSGRYSVREPDADGGTYYALAPASEAGGFNCRQIRSRVVEVG